MQGKDKIPAPNAVEINVKVEPLNDPGVIGENALSQNEASSINI